MTMTLPFKRSVIATGILVSLIQPATAGFDPKIHDHYCNQATLSPSLASAVKAYLESLNTYAGGIGQVGETTAVGMGDSWGPSEMCGLGVSYTTRYSYKGGWPNGQSLTTIFVSRNNPYSPTNNCASGERYNPISLQCETIPRPPVYTGQPPAPPTPQPLQVDPYKSAGCDNPNMEGNPVNSGWGNKCQSENGIGFDDPNTIPVNLFYNSYNNPTSGQPAGWSFRYGTRIVLSADTLSAEVYRPDGKIIRFTKNTAGAWSATSDVVDKLSPVLNAMGAITGWTYKTFNDETETYSDDGHLVRINFPSGLEYTITHGSFNSIAVWDNKGSWRVIFLSPSGKPTVTWNFLFGGSQYTWDINDNLASIRYSDGNSKQFVYEDARFPNALTGIIDENGSRYATWSYDDKGRAISSEHAGGVEKVTFEYSGTGTTKVTQANGASANWTFSSVQNVPLVTSKPAPCIGTCTSTSAQTFKYDSDGNLTEMVDYLGTKTTYKYDTARRLQIERIEAAGTAQARTIQTQWHASRRLPIKITEPNRVTSFTYDPLLGNLTQKTITAGSTTRTWKWLYGFYGRVVRATDPNNQNTEYTYNSDGVLLEVTNPLGQKIKYSDHTPQGWPQTRTDVNGVVTNLTYTPRGWLKSSTTAGEMTSYDYDKVGQLTKVTFPDGRFVSYTYDAAHRLTDIADSLGNKIHYTLDLMGNKLKEEIYDPSGALAAAMQAVDQSRQSPLPNPADAA